MAEPNGNPKQQDDDEQAQAKTETIAHDNHESRTRRPTRGLDKSIHRDWSTDEKHEITTQWTAQIMQSRKSLMAPPGTPGGITYWPTQGEHRSRMQGTVQSKQRRVIENKHESRRQGTAQNKPNGPTQMSAEGRHRSTPYRRIRRGYGKRTRRLTQDRKRPNTEAGTGQTGKQNGEYDWALPQQTEYDLMEGLYRMPGRVRSSSEIVIRERESSPESGAWSDPN